MYRLISFFIVVASLLALANAGIVYQRSYYLESADRVDLQRLTDRIEQLQQDELVTLARRLATISRSDADILLLMNQQFRQALLFVMLCLGAGCILLLYSLLRAWRQQGSFFPS